MQCLYQKSSTPPSDNPSERCFWVGALAILSLYSSGFTSSHIHLLLTELYLNCITTLYPKLTLDGKLQAIQSGCITLLLSKRRHQLNWEQVLQNYCPVSSESIQCALSGRPCVEKLPLFTVSFFAICLCIIVIYEIKRGQDPPQRPVNFMTKLQQSWPMQCQWNTERVSYFHQGS